jgi:putative phosphoesterase
MIAGVISDTHGLLRPEALAALHGVDCVIHAGDIGTPQVLEGLARIAPVHAIRGNNDRAQWAAHLPETCTLEVGGVVIYLIHDVKELVQEELDPSVQVVISGHSHVPKAQVRDSVLYLNPGSAGPRRFHLPIAVAHLEITRGTPHAKILALDLP